MLNKRCVEILQILIYNGKGYPVEKLSNQFNVSKRMIRYDIDTINVFLHEQNFPIIIKKANAPLYLTLKDEDKEKIKEALKNLNHDQYVFSTKERISIIIYELLSQERVFTYQQLQEKLSISKSTLFADMNKVKEWLKNHNIEINKVGNKGFEIVGDNISMKSATTALITNEIEYNLLSSLQKLYNKQDKSTIQSLEYIEYSEHNMKIIENLIVDVESEIGFISDEDFSRLVMSIYIIINRSKTTTHINDNGLEINDVTFKTLYPDEYKLSTHIIDLLEKEFKVKVSDHYIIYFTKMILAASKTGSNTYDSNEYFDACNIANYLIFEIRKKINKRFSMDNQLYESFVIHLKSFIFRLKYNIETKNPILDSIKINYEYEFNLIKDVLVSIKDRFTNTISEDEIGFLTLYICSALQETQNNAKKEKTSVLIVCASGYATGRLVENKIKSLFSVNVIGVTSRRNISYFLLMHEIDFIISTIELEDEYGAPIIKVSPLLERDEVEFLKQHLFEKSLQISQNTISDIISIINRSCTINDKTQLIDQLNDYFDLSYRTQSTLLNYINEEYIQLQVDVTSWQQAIHISAEPLIKNNIIEMGYVEGIISNLINLGMYIVIDDNIAIPHGKPEQYVNGSGVTFTTFKNPVIMDSHKNVRLFITIAAKDSNDQIDIIDKILKFIDNQKNLDIILNTTNKYEVIELLKL